MNFKGSLVDGLLIVIKDVVINEERNIKILIFFNCSIGISKGVMIIGM